MIHVDTRTNLQLGQIPLDLHECDPDFFITNCHKWLHAPRGAALLYTPRRNHSLIHPGNINYAYKDYSQCSEEAEVTAAYQLEFGWPGTMDFSSFLCIEAGKYHKCKQVLIFNASVMQHLISVNHWVVKKPFSLTVMILHVKEAN